MVSSRTASAPPQKKCKKKGLPHYFNATAPGIFVFYSAPATSREAYSPANGFRDSCRIAPFLPSRGNAPSAAFASFAGRHPGAAFPAPELSSLLRSSLVLTRTLRLHANLLIPSCG